MNTILQNAYPSIEEIAGCNCFPSDERFLRGSVAVIECIQEIPCNPCEAACKHGAIEIGNSITNRPVLKEDLCTGCGACVSKCPGLAIFIVNREYNEKEAAVTFPHEYLPLPKKGQEVDAVNRTGNIVCKGIVIQVNNSANNDCTTVITLAIPKEYANEVRGMKRLDREDAKALHECICNKTGNTDDTIVCRCEEVTSQQIKDAILDGAVSLTGIKRRTRAGMGLCQGRTCQKIISRMLCGMTGLTEDKIDPDTARPPVKPVSIAVLGGDEND